MPDDPSPTALSPATLARLERLALDHARLFELRQPITAALTIALTRSTAELDARDPAVETVEEIPAIFAIAEAMVRKAYKGDTSAFTAIVDRVEGKVGLRIGERDEASEAHRSTVQATIEGVVEALTNGRLGRPVDATLIDVTPTPQDVDLNTNNEAS